MTAAPRPWALACALAVAGGLGGCGDAPARARAQRLGSLEDVIGGPHAVGRVGDFLLENDQIRLIIADTGVSGDPTQTTYGRVNTPFGGSLIDADLRRVNAGRGGGGNDQLAELLPGLMFTVINPTDVCVPVRTTGRCATAQEKAAGAPVRDGTDGLPAEVLVIGTGGDLLQMIALLNTGIVFPSTLELRNYYRLAPGARYVEIETVVKNAAPNGGAHPFPYLDPSELDDLIGGAIPNLPSIQLSVPMGQLALFGGAQDLFAPGVAGFNVKYAIEDTYPLAGGFPAFPGMTADFLATRGPGVSYGLAIPPADWNFVNAYRTGYPGQDVSPTSMVLPFTYAGVAAAFMARPPDVLAAGAEFSFTSYFIIGDGDVASVVDTLFEIRGTPTGTFGGRVVDALSSAPIGGADVIIRQDGTDGRPRPIDHVRADDDGSFQARLAPGAYTYQVVEDDRPVTPLRGFTITAGQKTGVLVQMPAPATLALTVNDELGRRAPVKVTLVGTFDNANIGRDPRQFLYSLPLGEDSRMTAYDGTNQFVEGAWWVKDGRLDAKVRPGTYELVVSRGPEYELVRTTIILKEGQFVEKQVALTRAYESPGWIHADLHVHASPSTDSGLPIAERVTSLAAEGVDVAVATDHNYVTDYAPAIAAEGLEPWLLGIPGVELTTFEMGHFNAYPLAVDRGSTRGGEFAWTGQAPQQIFDQLRALAPDPARAIIQVNHPRQQVLGYFQQFFIDPATAAPYTPTGILGVFAPYGDEFAADKFSYDFDALELLTGKRDELVHHYRAPSPLPPGPLPDPQPVPGEIVVGSDGRPQYPGTVETWFALLEHGHTATGLGTSDTHKLLGDEPGYARTLLQVGVGKDTPGGFDRDDVIDAIRAHRAITTNGPLLEIEVGQGRIGDTVTGPQTQARVRVRTASWDKVDRVVVYVNGAIVLEQAIPITDGDDYEVMVPLTLTRDSWVVAEVTGSVNMFPVVTPVEFPPLEASVLITALSSGLDLSSLPLASPLVPDTTHVVTPYAITNPIWIDLDGNGWTAPLPALGRRAAPQATRPDVRRQFEALPELTP